MSKEQPLILVFYIDEMTLSQTEVMEIITENIREALEAKGVNAATFFLPTNDKERVECINPVIATDEQIEKINTLIGDIEKSFDLKNDLTDEGDYEGSAVKPFKGDD
jgi:hypothetical protein